jgi:hypothetical protein
LKKAEKHKKDMDSIYKPVELRTHIYWVSGEHVRTFFTSDSFGDSLTSITSEGALFALLARANMSFSECVLAGCECATTAHSAIAVFHKVPSESLKRALIPSVLRVAISITQFVATWSENRGAVYTIPVWGGFVKRNSKFLAPLTENPESPSIPPPANGTGLHLFSAVTADRAFALSPDTASVLRRETLSGSSALSTSLTDFATSLSKNM